MGSRGGLEQAPESTVGKACDSLSTGNIRRIFGRIFEISCAEWYTSVDSRRLSTVDELKSKAFLAVDSGAWSRGGRPPRGVCLWGDADKIQGRIEFFSGKTAFNGYGSFSSL
eukprot:5348242-Pyramimonas_sp.AAC.2